MTGVGGQNFEDEQGMGRSLIEILSEIEVNCRGTNSHRSQGLPRIRIVGLLGLQR